MDPYQEAIEEFRSLLERAREADIAEPTAMTLATADTSGQPSSRTVLLEGMDERGFVFYTNRRSRKGRDLIENPRASLCFLWSPLKKQVRVDGTVETVSDEEADEYFASRPRESQIGAWASHQSDVLDRRETLLRRAKEYQEKFAGQDVPRPPHWSGFRLIPRLIEYWTQGEFRLHERICYEKTQGDWTKVLLNP